MWVEISVLFFVGIAPGAWWVLDKHLLKGEREGMSGRYLVWGMSEEK